ncbi:MAG: hypothetical protein U5O39_02135 [Gammaproteobacteria bacterium]|nr:hypothetical protein [Gammaproteobacteria bacterium]
MRFVVCVRPDPVPGSIHQIWIAERTDRTLPAGHHARARRRGKPGSIRRDESLRLPRAEVTMRRNHIPFLSPEVALFFKAGATRDKDQADFERCLPHLTSDRRMWLRSSLERFFPDERGWLSLDL